MPRQTCCLPLWGLDQLKGTEKGLACKSWGPKESPWVLTSLVGPVGPSRCPLRKRCRAKALLEGLQEAGAPQGLPSLPSTSALVNQAENVLHPQSGSQTDFRFLCQ